MEPGNLRTNQNTSLPLGNMTTSISQVPAQMPWQSLFDTVDMRGHGQSWSTTWWCDNLSNLYFCLFDRLDLSDITTRYSGPDAICGLTFASMMDRHGK